MIDRCPAETNLFEYTYRCSKECGHAGDHYYQGVKSGVLWDTEKPPKCGAIYPLSYLSYNRDDYPCTEPLGHSGEHVHRRKLMLTGEEKIFAQWPQSFPDPADDTDETDAKMRDRFLEAYPSRRERIATAAMNALILNNANPSYRGTAEDAVTFADALIKELDK